MTNTIVIETIRERVVEIHRATGPRGPAGQDGTDGRDGTDGTDGANGAPGAAGPAGPAGQIALGILNTQTLYMTSSAEHDLASFAIGTAAEVGDILRFISAGLIANNSGSSVVYTFRWYINGTLVMSSASSIPAATSVSVWLELLTNLIDTAVQNHSAQRIGSSTVANGAIGAINGTHSGVGFATSTVDVTSGITIKLTCQRSNAGGTVRYTHNMSALERLSV